MNITKKTLFYVNNLIIGLIYSYLLIINIESNPFLSLFGLLPLILFIFNIISKSNVREDNSDLTQLNKQIYSIIEAIDLNNHDTIGQVEFISNENSVSRLVSSVNDLLSTIKKILKKQIIITELQDLTLAEKTDTLFHAVNELTITKNQQHSVIKEIKTQNESLLDYTLSVSHDLKAPLRAITHLIELLLEDSDIHQEKLKYIKMIQEKLDLLDSMINGLLQISRIGKSEDIYSYINIEKALNDVLNLITPLPNSLKIEKELKIDEIYFDETNFRQILLNLIQNAFKYNDKDTIKIKILSQMDKSGNYYEIIITDNGTGINSNIMDKVFNLFSTFDKNRSGTGIGLSLVKRIIDLAGGNIWIESEIGKYTTFFLQIPVKI